MQRRAAAGEQFQAIAGGLMEDGIPTARRKARWFPATIKAVTNSDNAAAPRNGRKGSNLTGAVGLRRFRFLTAPQRRR
jgi:hypothetical protein